MKRRHPWNFVSQITIVLLLAMTVAQPILAVPRPVAELPDTAGETIAGFRTLAGDAADAFVTRALRSSAYWDFRDNLDESFGKTFQLQPVAAHAKAGHGMVGVFIPVDGGAGYSGLQLWFQENTRELVTSVALLFEQVDPQRVAATYFADGQLRMEAVSDLAGNILSGRVIEADGSVQDLLDYPLAERSYGCINDCLAGLGVANWIIALIAAVCGIACLGTLGAGCVACIFGLGVGLGAELGYCSGRCS
ncbi:MAG: hypothetical protein AAGN66_26070 [Acidobacteriota bacterium]